MKLDEGTVAHLRQAVELCGYDFDEVMSNHTRLRTYVDIRSVVWEICATETAAFPGEIGRRFGWNRSTVSYAIDKARELREYDRQFRSLYDSIYSFYMVLESNDTEFEDYAPLDIEDTLEGEMC